MLSEIKIDESFPKQQFNISNYKILRRDRNKHSKGFLLDRRQRGPIRSVLLVIIGWMVTQFSQKRLQGFF